MSDRNLNHLVCTHPDGATIAAADDAVQACIEALSALAPLSAVVASDVAVLLSTLREGGLNLRSNIEQWNAAAADDAANAGGDDDADDAANAGGDDE